MRKMTFLVAALALAISGSAYAGEKVDTAEDCCRTGDDGCNAAYEASCDDTANIGYFCSTDKNDKDGDGNTKDRVVWQFVCDTAAGEVCTNTNGNINCPAPGDVIGTACTSTDAPYCKEDKSAGYYCNTSSGVWGGRTCGTGQECIIRGTSVVCEEPGGPTEATCDKATATATCSASGKTGWYCSNNGKWTSKTCDNADCNATGNSVKCGEGGGTVDPEKPTGTCDPATVEGKCNSTNTIGYYCKSDGTWTSKTCESCQVNTAKANSVTCGGGGGGEQGTECSAGEVKCESATAGWYCSNGNKKAYTCNDGTCGTKTYNNKKQVTCCTQNASGEWYDVKYSTDACESVYGQGTDPVDPPPSGCSQDNYCSADGKLAYNCNGTSLVPTACMEGKSCKLNNGKAECVGSINPGSKDDDDDDSGCAAAGAGLMLGWLGLALVPALRRRKK